MKPEMEKLAEVRGQGGDVLFTIYLNPNRRAELGRGLIESEAPGRENEKSDQGSEMFAHSYLVRITTTHREYFLS